MADQEKNGWWQRFKDWFMLRVFGIVYEEYLIGGVIVKDMCEEHPARLPKSECPVCNPSNEEPDTCEPPRVESVMEDSCDYNPDGKTIDDLVMSGAYVHLEQLNDGVFMLIVENERHHWHMRIASRSGRAFVDAWMMEEWHPATPEETVSFSGWAIVPPPTLIEG